MSVLIIILLAAVIVAPILIPVLITVFIVKLVKKSKQKNQENSENQETPAKPPKPKREPLSPSAVMLLIGTAFIVLSGIAFGVASWVKTTPMGRVGIMFIACAVSFGLSGFFRKVFKLNGTSVSFYTSGTIFVSVTLITAGYYNIFGNWFSVSGQGAGILYMTACMIISALSIFAYNLYNHKAFSYVGISAGFLVVPCIIYQFAETFRQAALLAVIFQTIITALIKIFKVQRITPFKKQIDIVGSVFSVILAVFSMMFVFDSSFRVNMDSVIILALIIAQLIFYGICFENKGLISAESVVCIYTAFVISIMAENMFNDDIGTIVFGVVTFLICIAHRFVPHLKNDFTVIFTFIAGIIGSIISASRGYDEYFAYGMIPLLLMTFMTATYIFNESAGIQTLSGLISPILLCYIANNYMHYFFKVSDMPDSDITAIVLGILAFAMTAVSALIIYLPKYAFSFHAKHPLKSNMIIYANIYLSAYALFRTSEYSRFIIIPIAVCIIHFFVSNKMSNNLASAGSVASLIIMAHTLSEHFSNKNNDITMYVMFGLFILLMTASRIFFKESFMVKTDEKTAFDTSLIGGAVTIFLMLDGNKTHSFFTLLATAVYFACFVKKNTSKDSACILLSISAVLTAFAFINRPFLVSDNELVTDKITLAIIALTGTAYKFIWKSHPSASKISSTFIYMLSFAGLIFDAVKFHTAGNTIFVLCITTGIMILSFMTKSKTWFTASSIALAFITVYSSRKYLMTMGWWAYLFMVGIILITIASANEYCKQKGISLKDKLALKFSDWSW